MTSDHQHIELVLIKPLKRIDYWTNKIRIFNDFSIK